MLDIRRLLLAAVALLFFLNRCATLAMPSPPPTPARPQPAVVLPDGGLDVTDRTTTTVRAFRSKPPPAVATSSSPPELAASGTASIEQLDALADCESGDGDGRPPYTYSMAATNGPYRGPFQWAQRWWDRHVTRMGRPELVGADLHTLPYETQRAVTQAVPLSAWDTQFPSCLRVLQRLRANA